MVKRKPVGQDNLVPAPLSQAVGNPPYPTSPTESRTPAAIPPIPSGMSQSMSNREDLRLHPESSFEIVGHADVPRLDGTTVDEESSDDEWGGDTDDEEDDQNKPAHQDLPASLKSGGDQHRQVLPPAPASDISLPPALRPGPPQGYPQHSQVSLISAQSTGSNPWQSTEAERLPSATFKSNNPFLRSQHSGQDNQAAMESSSSIWADVPTANTQAKQGEIANAVELPTTKTPTDAFAQLSVLDNQKPAAMHTRTPSNPDQPPLLSVEAERESMLGSHTNLSNTSSPVPVVRPPIPAVQDFSRQAQPVQAPTTPNVWDDLDHQLAAEQAGAKELAHMNQINGQSSNAGSSETRPVPEAPPDLPPRHSQDEEPAPAMPPRPQVQIPPTVPAASASSRTESPNTAAQRQRKEHYSIKHIRWFDASFDQMRESPILIQNLNGPCPLLALVNALVLSTAPGLDTGLIQTLRTREQVSLGLLLDSVFDELVSGRRGDTAANLPDVSELYQFLLTLHTGMNVNPRFIPKAGEAPNLMDADGPVAETQPTPREPGGFEETKEMRLYSTFDVPLIHGWLPPKGSEAYNAFNRSAKTFEDAQNIQFYEEELDERLRNSGLNPEEIRQFEDITTIKEFLNRWPTQLTDYGLNIIKERMIPASISIFFRNDHFSTLYKEPRTGQLMGLVTDAGYSTHDEIVWESLSDVNGRESEFFSGDFRPVGGPTPAGPSGPAGPRDSSSHTAQNSLTSAAGPRGSPRPDSLQPPANPRDSGIQLGQQESGVLHADGSNAPTSPNTEQEDHDLALALQLQEEEEDRARRERAQRQAQDEQLAQTFLESDGQARRGSAQQQQQQAIRSLVPPRRNGAGAAQSNSRSNDAAAGDDAPPPSYEQAARRPAYHPPPGHPSSTNASVSPQGRGQQSSAYGQNRSRLNAQQGPASGGRGRGRGATYGGNGSGYGQPVAEDRDKCVVM